MGSSSTLDAAVLRGDARVVVAVVVGGWVGIGGRETEFDCLKLFASLHCEGLPRELLWACFRGSGKLKFGILGEKAALVIEM